MLIVLLSITCLVLVILSIIQQRRNRALRQDRQGFLALAENSPDLIFRYDRQGRRLYVSPAVTRLFGVSVEDIVGKSPSDNPLLDSGENRKLLDGIRRVFETGEKQEIEVVFADQQGHTRSYNMLLIPECDAEGQVSTVLVLNREITAIRDAEQELKQALESIEGIINAIPDLLFEFDLNGTYLNVWAQDPALLVLQKETLLGSTIHDGLPPDAAETAMSAIEEADRKGSSFGKVMHIELPQGERWFELSVSRKPGSSDTDRRFIALSRDITERRQAEMTLATREREFRRLAESLPDSIIRYDREGVTVYFNPVLERTLGESAAAMIGKTTREYHPDGSFEDYAQLLDAVLASGEAGELEKLLPGPDGETYVNQIRIVPEFDSDGEVVGALAIGHDITARKRAEEKLRLAASVFTNTNEGIIVTSADNLIIDVNDSFTRITGYTREEVIGKNPKLLSSQRQPPGFYAELWRNLQQTGHWVGEIWNRRKNGEEYPEWQTISVVNDEQGRLSHYVAVFSDITLIKKQEQQLQRIAHHDALTGLPNRLLFLDRLKQAEAQVRRTGSLLAVCYGDLDGFKPVNDRYGHEAGDVVLVMIGKRMQECVRSGDTVGRIGGDEFVILLMNLEGLEECEMVLTRLLDEVAQPIQLEGHSVSVSASLGVALFPQDDADPDLLLRHADQAMYQAKRRGKGIIRFFDPDQP